MLGFSLFDAECCRFRARLAKDPSCGLSMCMWVWNKEKNSECTSCVLAQSEGEPRSSLLQVKCKVYVTAVRQTQRKSDLTTHVQSFLLTVPVRFRADAVKYLRPACKEGLDAPRTSPRSRRRRGVSPLALLRPLRPLCCTSRSSSDLVLRERWTTF